MAGLVRNKLGTDKKGGWDVVNGAGSLAAAAAAGFGCSCSLDAAGRLFAASVGYTKSYKHKVVTCPRCGSLSIGIGLAYLAAVWPGIGCTVCKRDWSAITTNVCLISAIGCMVAWGGYSGF